MGEVEEAHIELVDHEGVYHAKYEECEVGAYLEVCVQLDVVFVVFGLEDGQRRRDGLEVGLCDQGLGF